jgi:hypothetical protein
LEETVLQNLQAFCQSKKLGGSGTHQKGNQAVVEHALVAANWSEPLMPTEIRSYFGTNLTFFKKILAMVESESINSKRKTRIDFRLEILQTCVQEWQHDDSVNRVDNGGKTAENQVWIGLDGEGKAIYHPLRIWPCLTIAEKLRLFLESEYYDKFVDILRSNEYFAERLCPAIQDGETKLRRALGRPLDIRLTRKILFEELEKLKIQPKKTAKWTTLVKQLHYALLNQHLEQSSQDFDWEIDVGAYCFEKCFCPCVVNPRMESCVDTLKNQIEVFSRSLNDNLFNCKPIKEAFDKCNCENCKIVRDPEDK